MRVREIARDLTVVGGGLAGVCAAIAAARQGLSVALVQDRPVLGGNSSSEIRVWVCGATAHGMQRWARENGIIGELMLENQYRNPDGNPVLWDDVVLDAVRAEPGVTLCLNTAVDSVEMAVTPDGTPAVAAVSGWTLGSETRTTFRSPLFVDASGDGTVAALAGARFRLGREARAEFGEPWAPEVADQALLGSTLLFYTKDAGHPVPFVAPASAKDVSDTPILAARAIGAHDQGADYWWIEWGGDLDVLHDNESIRDELRAVVLGVFDHIKNSGRFDAANLTLEWIGNVVGKREYRRFIGDHTLTQQEVIGQADCPDAVGYGGWGVDLHPVEGMYTSEPGALQRNPPGVYPIPYRCLYAADLANVFLAGRDISVSHVALGSTRLMATCAVLGEAVGVAAAVGLDHGVTPRGVAESHVRELQQRLWRADAALVGVRADDPADLAVAAAVTASTTCAAVGSAFPWAVGGAAAWAGAPRLDLADDIGLVVPVDPDFDGLDVVVQSEHGGRLAAEVWSTGRPQNAVPVTLEGAAAAEVPAGLAWVHVPLAWHPPEPANAVIVLKAAPGLALPLAQNVPPGVLTLVRGAPTVDPNVQIADGDLVVQWPAHPARGTCPVFALAGVTRAYAPDKAVGGYRRPYGGPQMWVSGPPHADPRPSLTLTWAEPVTVAEVDLVFDDDVDHDLSNLHHHRTAWRVPPTLVRDYRVEAWDQAAGAWVGVVAVEGNRARHAVHRLGRAAVTTALRLTVLATSGVGAAHVVSWGVYGPGQESGRRR
jgi:hypothetical protein